MGHYSVLHIGEEELLWKYDIPSYLSFLFNESDRYTISDDENEGYQFGFKTSCEVAIKKLDQLGFDWKMIVDIYEFFYHDLKESVYENIEESIQEKYNHLDDIVVKKKIAAYFDKLPSLTKLQELKDFTSFIRPMIAVTLNNKSVKVKSIDGYTYTVRKRYKDSIMDYFLWDAIAFLQGKELQLPPWIQIIGSLFDMDLLMEYNEIISLVQLKLLLEANEPSTMVDLHLGDIMEKADELSNFHMDSANRLIGKINLYNKFFNSIMHQEVVIKEMYFKQQVGLLIANLANTQSSFEKGKNLETLMELIFSSISGLEVISKRVDNGDEEIDLLMKNNISRTFWTGLTSPLIIAECKNWTSKVGAKEIRDFEGKMINHGKMVKVGIFIAFNGFTSEVDNALKRMSRSDYHMVLVEGKAISELVATPVSTIEWLEKLVSKLY